MQAVRMLEAEWGKILWESMSTGAKEDESNTGHMWAAAFHHVTAHSHLARFETYEPFISSVFKVWGGGETANTESVNMGARLYFRYV
jgi:uncharacterized MAPEG superfamily protein